MEKTLAQRRKSVKTSIDFPEKSLTKQSFKDETNINKIMAKFEKTGIVEHISERQGQYGDFTNVKSYRESLDQINKANEMFMRLPAKIRKHFDNDPVKFVEIASDPTKIKELIELGLAPEKRSDKRAQEGFLDRYGDKKKAAAGAKDKQEPEAKATQAPDKQGKKPDPL